VQWALLADLPSEELRELLQIARRRRFARNEVVFHADDPGDSLHLIVKGRFALRVMTPLGDTATLAVRGPGDSFGEMALVSETAQRTATVAALEDAETFAVYRREFERLRLSHPAVDQLLFRFIVDEVRALTERLLEALYMPVERRVLRRLLEVSRLYPADDGEPLIPLTQEVLAELAGTTRSTVNRVLNDEVRRGTIALERRKTRLLDPDALARRARQ
jgi:CRP/FNR family transcriptional regulator, cyclic AMP receptor protein